MSDSDTRRMLTLLPYLLERPGISADAAAVELGITRRKLEQELNHMMCYCGTPGLFPDDLVDLSIDEDGTIVVRHAAGLDRPLRLTSPEATALLVAISALLEQPGMVDETAAQSALEKIENAAGEAALAGPIASAASSSASKAATEAVRTALEHKQALRLNYYSASRDAQSERTVDPIRIVLLDNNSYLQAWCRTAEAVRLFRFDRIESALELNEPAVVPADVTVDKFDTFGTESDLPLARLRLNADAAWLAEDYSMTTVASDATTATLDVEMRYGSVDWMVRLILGFGAAVAVVGPPELRKAVHVRATAALDAYANA